MSSLKERATLAKHYFNDVERAVVKSTTKKVKPLKPKHVRILTECTWHREVSMTELFRLIHQRIKEGHWAIVFKSLILVHILVREGSTERVLGYLTGNPTLLNMSGYRDKSHNPLGNAQAKNIRAYATYLEEKVFGFREVGDDFVRSKDERIAIFRSLPVEEGLLRQVELLQKQIQALLGCTFYLDEIDNVITLQAFRLLIGDMMQLFHLMNEGVIRILGSYFEMTKSDATQALQIYQTFAQQTGKTVQFFEIARKLKSALGMDVPVFKHAPVSLAGALEEYLRAPDFEAQRLAYKQKKQAARQKQQSSSQPEKKTSQESSSKPKPEPDTSSQKSAPPPKKQQAPDIDFFSSLDEELNAFKSPSVQATFDMFSNMNNNDGAGFSYYIPQSQGNPFMQQQQQMQMQQQMMMQQQQQQQMQMQMQQQMMMQQQQNGMMM
ncbi:hypothetical protein HK102_008185, partial [Quaeritorhiza haematococci]